MTWLLWIYAAGVLFFVLVGLLEAMFTRRRFSHMAMWFAGGVVWPYLLATSLRDRPRR